MLETDQYKPFFFCLLILLLPTWKSPNAWYTPSSSSHSVSHLPHFFISAFVIFINPYASNRASLRHWNQCGLDQRQRHPDAIWKLGDQRGKGERIPKLTLPQVIRFWEADRKRTRETQLVGMNRAQVRGSHRLIRPSCYFHRDLQLNFSRYPDGIVVDPSPIIVLLCLSERILWVQQEWKPLQIIYWLSIRHQFPVIIYSGGHLIEPNYDPHQEPHSHQRRSIGNDSRLISRRYSNECSGRMRNDSQLHTQCWMAISNYQFPIISQSGGVLLWIKPSYDPHKKPYSDQYWLIRDDSSPLFFIFLHLSPSSPSSPSFPSSSFSSF